MNLIENTLDFKFYKLHEEGKPPQKKTGDIGWDLSCIADNDFQQFFIGQFGERELINCYEIQANHRHVFHTGISIELPETYHAILMPRSGLAVKNGIEVLAGVIDNSYRGEILICLQNSSHHTVRICPGDRIAQMIIIKEHEGSFREAELLNETNRGEKGFGSSGK